MFTRAVESTVNRMESKAGRDLDGDGDVGMMGSAPKVAKCGEGPTTCPTEEIRKNTNIAENYKWTADNRKVHTRCELKKVANEAKLKGVPLRVLASGWSCNRFIDPTQEDKAGLGINIELCGELCGVVEMTDTTVTAMAGTMRGPIYEVLDKADRQLEASGECYTEKVSQQVGGLLANGVHDTMQRAFTPETVPSLEALVFENGHAVIKTFTAADCDDFYSFFGGMGMTGIIVSATLWHVPKTYYHQLCYLPGVAYMHDPSLQVHKKAMTQEELVLIHGIKAQGPGATDKCASEYTSEYLQINQLSPFKTYNSPFATALKDLVAKHLTGRKDVAAIFYQFPDPEKKETMGSVCSIGLGRFYRCVNPDGHVEDLPEYTVTEGKFNNLSPEMGKAFLLDKRTVESLQGALAQVQDSIQDLKWKYANLMNLPADACDDLKKVAITSSAQHWAYVDPKVAHTTGPDYIYLWAKATEFYIRVKDIDAFAEISQKAVMAMTAKARSSGELGTIINADCRYALGTKSGFMTGFYGEDSLAIDFGCEKLSGYTNELYTEMTKKVSE